MISLKEVCSRERIHTDWHGRKSSDAYASHTKTILINPTQIVSVVSVPSRIVESEGQQPIELCKVTTISGVHTVVGSPASIQERIFGNQKELLKG